MPVIDFKNLFKKNPDPDIAKAKFMGGLIILVIFILIVVMYFATRD